VQSLIYFFRFAHHGRYSSYCHLADFLQAGCRQVSVPVLSGLLGNSPRLTRLWFRLNEFRLLPSYLSRQPRCIHYLYPENTLFRGLHWKRGHRLILTWHQPMPYFRSLPVVIQDRFQAFLEQATSVVFLSTESARQYGEAFRINDSRVIWHGVDTDFFAPRPRKTTPEILRIVTVGNWMRDHDLWARTVNYLGRERADVEFHVLCNASTAKSYGQELEKYGGKTVFVHNLGDHQLREFYHQADIAFLPLLDATANNALLECMACGIPCAVTDLPATREYAADSALYFGIRNVHEAAETLRKLAASPSLRESLGSGARARAVVQLDWRLVADRHLELYAESGPTRLGA
jgi:glycosyltransferase involved in cell wall biosynthesis